MKSQTSEAIGSTSKLPNARVVIPVLGIAQILAWGSSYYLLAVLAKPIATETGWSLEWVVGGLSLGLLIAGIVSPRVGDSIQKYGGRPVLSASAVLLGLGMVGLAVTHTLPLYLLSWVVLGVGMGAGLYDAAFGTLGRMYGQRARTAIATLTLFGGFASTVCWPISAALVSELGWRGACLVYAAIHLFILLPLYFFALPKEAQQDAASSPLQRNADLNHRQAELGPPPKILFLLVAAVITISSMISALVSVHLLTILQARDIALAAAVALGAIVGPAQVGARAIQMLITRHHHPIWTKLASAIFIALGIAVLWAGLPIVSAALIFYGAGIGIESIARGTLPLALFGEHRYAAIVGRIAMPSLIAQAASPSLGAILIERLGANGTLATLFTVALANVLLVGVLLACIRRRNAPMLSQ